MSFEWKSGKSTGGRSAGEGVGGDLGKRTLTSRIAPKLMVGTPGGAHEAEADAVAGTVGHALGGGATPASPIAISSIGAAEVQGKGAEGGEVPGAVHAAMGDAGQPLEHRTAGRMSQGFGGHDFSGVKIHTGGAAATAAGELGAAAYTVGQDVYFGAGQYAPETPAGRDLLAHELTHTVQQKGAAVAQRRLIQRHPGPVTAPAAAATTGAAGAAGATGEDKTDGEGNAYREAAGKTYLTAPPKTPVPFHSGKAAALPANPHERSATLTAQVAAAAAQQRAYAETLKGGVNPPKNYRYWFARVYQFVTEAESRAIAKGTYQYPLMKMQEVIWFQNAYQANSQAWDSGNQGKLEPHWRAAFAAAEAKQSNDVSNTSHRLEGVAGGAVGGVVGGKIGAVAAGPLAPLGMLGGGLLGGAVGAKVATVLGDAMTSGSRAVLSALLPSMQAHIRFDLPRAIAGCFASYYAGIPGLSMVDFQPDFDAMGPVFDEAQGHLNPEIEAACGPMDPGTWKVAQAAFPMFFDVAKERTTTWMKAQSLEESRKNGDDNLTAARRMRAVTQAGAPISGASSYQVDGGDIGEGAFDWQHNPGAAPPQTGP